MRNNPVVDVGKKKIRIISIDGKTVYQGILTDDENQVDISSLQKGIYFVKMSSGERVLTGKVVVQ
ncbi:MAG: T9SS type A sorting domain-containing protein [Bacteroidales bacterium]